MTAMTTYTEVMNPTAPAGQAAVPLAAGLDTLEGKTIGVLSNQKVNADEVLEALAARLRSHYGVRDVVKRVKRIQSQGAPTSVLNELLERSDAIITGVGD
jgi:hypothetical protein